MQHIALSADGKTCCIRRARVDDIDQITQLIHSSSIHASGFNRKRRTRLQPTGKKPGSVQRVLFKINFSLFASHVQWQNYFVAISPEGLVIGCCQVKQHGCGTREVDTLCLDSAWRNGTIAARLMRYVIANSPHPLWGTCMDNVVAFQKRNGAVQVTDPGLMPPVLRRRWRMFNFLLRVAGRKNRLHVMMVANEAPADKQTKNISACARGNTSTTMRKALLQRIKKYQLKKSRPFCFPGRYETIQGLFVSYATYTFSLFQKYFKKQFHFRLPDNNAFVTFWTLELLLEACNDSRKECMQIRVNDAVKALMGFHDQTRTTDDPLFVFWRQHKINKHPVVCPVNLMALSRMVIMFDSRRKKLTQALSKIIPRSKNAGGHPSHAPPTAAFNLPADFDDAALNWSLGSCLSEYRDLLADACSVWSQNSFDFSKLARHALASAYRPFSNDRDANTIDPRSFYAIRTFLWELQDSGRDLQNFSLLTTWASTISKNQEGMRCHYKMPFNVNNLDCSVQANFIHAACKSALNGSFPRDVEHFDDLIIDTAQYLAWAVASGTIIQQPDITLLYYPTPTCAFFFISRIVQQVHNAQQQNPAHALCRKIETILVPSAQKHITDFLMSSVAESDNEAFWQRLFLKQPTALSRNNALNDRKFMTAASLNCLFNLWTLRRKERLEWLPSVPCSVVTAARKSLAWLKRYGLSHADHNTFFSASVKHRLSLPFAFPANMTQNSQAPVLQPGISRQSHDTARHNVYAMSGVPSREDYERLLREKGLDTVEEGAFQKCFELDYPYWSAPTVTSALVLLALSKAEALGL